MRDILNRVQPKDIDHMMCRVFSLSEGCSFVAEAGHDNDYFMNEGQVFEALKYYDGLSEDDKASLDVIAKRYGEVLARVRMVSDEQARRP